ncbi:hypothetical protein [Candidatus Pantoea persica]|uniref:hypothetical protein n=1 Tax=Candidatus Pantoea persica TaxID=2518128 RepID=UPI00215DA2A5|nr:hypothetical protein [Candidatus Pantoea persica]
MLRAAGWAQSRAGTSSPAFGDWYRSAPYGDDPDNQSWIRMGIEYAKRSVFKKTTSAYFTFSCVILSSV